ncbi:MAG: hypothetical protein ACJAZO_002469 [Myxococcota bacterium]|jgi:hypothetical protein
MDSANLGAAPNTTTHCYLLRLHRRPSKHLLDALAQQVTAIES